MEISVSYLKSKYDKEKTISLIEASSASSIHVALMDGDYVPVINNDLTSTIKLLKSKKKPLEIHLMMNKELSTSIDFLAVLKPRIIIIPLDIPNVLNYINQIKEYNIKVGLAIHPDSKINEVIPYLNYIDSILVMSVYPGKGGQSFLENTVDRLKELTKIINNHNITIGVDGGINDNTIGKIKAFVQYAISGSYICMSDNYQSQIDKLL